MRKFEISQKFWSLAGKFDIFDEDSRLAYQVQLLRMVRKSRFKNVFHC